LSRDCVFKTLKVLRFLSSGTELLTVTTLRSSNSILKIVFDFFIPILEMMQCVLAFLSKEKMMWNIHWLLGQFCSEIEMQWQIRVLDMLGKCMFIPDSY
jgi:hypothetical protein